MSKFQSEVANYTLWGIIFILALPVHSKTFFKHTLNRSRLSLKSTDQKSEL